MYMVYSVLTKFALFHAVLMQVPLENVCLIDKYAWMEVERALGETLLSRLAKNMTVPLVVIR